MIGFQRIKKQALGINITLWIWALVGCLFFILAALASPCVTLEKYFFAWAGSYICEIFACSAFIFAMKRDTCYVFAYVLFAIVILYKIAVIASLGDKVWNGVIENDGVCSITQGGKDFIMAVNVFQLMLFVILYLFLWRIKIVQRQSPLAQKVGN